MNFLLSNAPIEDHSRLTGGKVTNLARLIQAGIPVPNFIGLTKNALNLFIESNSLGDLLATQMDPKEKSEKVEVAFLKAEFPDSIKVELIQLLEQEKLSTSFLAIRSSGLDEDGKDHSFAGQFSSFLFQKDINDIVKSIKLCWASAYSDRVLHYRRDNGLIETELEMGVVIQKMVNSNKSGVMFTRNPINPVDRETVIIDAVWGQGEGLVSGILPADDFKVHRTSNEIESLIEKKEEKFIRNKTNDGIEKVMVPSSDQEKPVLTDLEILHLKDIGVNAESRFGYPLDIEWAMEEGKIYIVQMRPITNLPTNAFYDKSVNGEMPILWDNSNIIESFSGVTTPLTFSATRECYGIVYRETARLLGVPENIISKFNHEFEHMLGFVRGRVYYNLVNWYKLLFLMPGAASNKSFMETMLGVKEDLHEDHQKLFDFVNTVPRYSPIIKFKVFGKFAWRFFNINTIVSNFLANFEVIYTRYKKTKFNEQSLPELIKLYENWQEQVTYGWKPPIINDFFCMFFFGVLKKLTEKWIKTDKVQSLQNDLLCGQGDLESTMPTKTLMKIAAEIDKLNESIKSEFVNGSAEVATDIMYKNEEFKNIRFKFEDFLDRYGFRCNDEQKLEENDLTDDPTFAICALQSYVRTQSYSIEKMRENELAIREKAETIVAENLSFPKKQVYCWFVKHAREAVKNRENLRFARTKSFGVTRRLFRAIGEKLVQLEVIEEPKHVFYLNIDEIRNYIYGVGDSLLMDKLAQIRKEEFDHYRAETDPPDRFISYGAAGATLSKPPVIINLDLLKKNIKISDDPNLFYGISCSPGVIEKTVRVVETIEEAQGLDGEILVTYRTDPGWVPLFPSCSGLIIERGSLLSHSAVVARELGLPTIVGVNGGIMGQLKTGDKVLLNATDGEIRRLV